MSLRFFHKMLTFKYYYHHQHLGGGVASSSVAKQLMANGNGISGHSRSSSLSHNIHAVAYSELSAAPPAFATPPTRRRFFNHKNLRSALTGGGGGGSGGGGGGGLAGGVGGGHRRTASNGGCPIDTASILSGGKFRTGFKCGSGSRVGIEKSHCLQERKWVLNTYLDVLKIYYL